MGENSCQDSVPKLQKHVYPNLAFSETDLCHHFLYKMSGSWYLSSQCRDTTSNRIFFYKSQVWGHKEKKDSFLKTLFCWARCQDNWKRSLWSFSIQNNRVLVPLEPVQGHHFKPNFFYKLQTWGHKGKQKSLWENPFCCARCQDNWKNSCDHFLYKISGFWYLSSHCRGHNLKPNIWRHKGKQTHFEQTYSVGDLPKKTSFNKFIFQFICARARTQGKIKVKFRYWLNTKNLILLS